MIKTHAAVEMLFSRAKASKRLNSAADADSSMISLGKGPTVVTSESVSPVSLPLPYHIRLEKSKQVKDEYLSSRVHRPGPQKPRLMAQPGLPGFDNSLRPVGYLQLVENVGNMITDRFGANMETLGNFLIAFSPGDKLEHFPFAVG